MEQTVTTKLGGVHSGHLHYVWDQVWPILDRAFQHTRGEYPRHFIWEALQEKEWQLWILFDEETDDISGAALTRLEKYPNFIVCHLIAAAGATQWDWKAALPIMERWAIDQGAKYFRWWGRKGTFRMAKDVGFKQDYVVLTKELDAQLH
jgi:hypothetical protein